MLYNLIYPYLRPLLFSTLILVNGLLLGMLMTSLPWMLIVMAPISLGFWTVQLREVYSQ